MRQSPIRYLLWVLLPVGAGALLGHHLISNALDGQAGLSSTRMGQLAAGMISQEMGKLAGDLARTAPLLTDPDLDSPLIRAAARGDTIAALGSSSGSLTLSVALAEEAGDSLQIRATTAPFLPATLEIFRQRTGTGVALYLRGARVTGAPQDFGPLLLGSPDAPAPSGEGIIPHGTVLLPLVTARGLISPAQLLAAPLRAQKTESPPWGGLLVVLLAWGAGLLAWIGLHTREEDAPPRPIRLLTPAAVPLLVLWVFVFWGGNRVASEAEEAQREDMVRVLALARDGQIPLSPGLIQKSTGFQVVRSEVGRVTESTVPVGPLLAAILELPLPPPTFPALGTVRDESREMVYANLREGPGRALTLLVPAAAAGIRGLRLALAALAGVVSLLALGFLSTIPRREGP